MSRLKDDYRFKKEFGELLRNIFTLYELDYLDFCKKYNVSDSTFRYWFNGVNLPQSQYMENIKEYLRLNLDDDNIKKVDLENFIFKFLSSINKESLYDVYKAKYTSIKNLSGEILELYRNCAKHLVKLENIIKNDSISTGYTQIVVFDFDGTLTVKEKINQTTWESIWIKLGYSKKDCQDLHQKFNKKFINHEQWCKITEEKFKQKNLNKDIVESIAENITLINGISETLEYLYNHDIKVYIVSGSIDTVIYKVLGDLKQFIHGIQANHFKYDKNGKLKEIVGTKYDFEGKSTYISKLISEYKVSPKDVLFIGNSTNDKFAHVSGARTLCINPRLTDPSDIEVWHNCIQSCDDLQEILLYLKYDNM